ncbi:MAG: hypothetical protein ACREP8_15310, partial [Candidatus Binatia bacterium]
IESFSQGKLARRLHDADGDGKFDTIYFFQDNELAWEERDTQGDGAFDLRVFYENGQVARQEADSNGDRRVDVWVTYQNGKRWRQEEDLNFNGKIDARYFFREEQLTGQEQLAEVEPDQSPAHFSSVEDELQRATGTSVPLQRGVERQITAKSRARQSDN